MRLLLANEELDDAGGVGTYLRGIAAALRERGHSIAFLHHGRQRPAETSRHQAIGVLDNGLDAAMRAVEAWRPDVCFSHNMGPLEVDAALLRRWPVVKMMHGYFGTCLSARKLQAFPRPNPCGRPFGAACLAYYYPRRCGGRDPRLMLSQVRWTRQQRALWPDYASFVVASAHMRAEYIANGVPAARVHSVPLFAPEPIPEYRRSRSDRTVLFIGRMTDLKGGHVLIEALAHAAVREGQPSLVMAGDGPARRDWEALARARHVRAQFTGWVDPRTRSRLLEESTVLVLPGVWPEPFGLVGLEAAAAGVPAVAFDSGGVREWLQHGVNGVLVSGPPDSASLGRALAALLEDRERVEDLGRGALATARRMTLARHVDSLLARALAPAARS